MPLFPSAESFAEVEGLTPQVPVAYLDQVAQAPAGWSAGLRCGYVAFGDAYYEEARRAEAAGRPVRQLELAHLGMLTDPELVAAIVEQLALGIAAA